MGSHLTNKQLLQSTIFFQNIANSELSGRTSKIYTICLAQFCHCSCIDFCHIFFKFQSEILSPQINWSCWYQTILIKFENYDEKSKEMHEFWNFQSSEFANFQKKTICLHPLFAGQMAFFLISKVQVPLNNINLIAAQAHF